MEKNNIFNIERALLSKDFKDLVILQGKSKKFLGGINNDIRIIN